MPELKKEYFSLNDVLYAVTGMYNDDKDFEYLLLIPDYSITIFADKSQLIRVFTNIIQNATQAIPEDRKGNISLVVSKVKDNYIRVTISDNGEGISKEKGEKLFQPYFTTKTSGTGLGLAMCKDIMEQFGGKITYESIEHEGTSFHIDLPILDEDADIT
jgi:signal transduction histidine kinase